MIKKIMGLLISIVLCISMMPLTAIADTIVDEVRISCSVTSVEEGELPVFEGSSESEHIKMFTYKNRNCWVEWLNGSWCEVEDDDRNAVSDENIRYGMAFCIDVEPGYELDPDYTKVYFNDEDITSDGYSTIFFRNYYPYVVIDLGTASKAEAELASDLSPANLSEQASEKSAEQVSEQSSEQTSVQSSETDSESVAEKSVESSKIYVNGVAFDEENASSGIACGDGIATYDVATNTVTLKDATVTELCDDRCVYAESDLNLVVEGDCKINAVANENAIGIGAKGDIYITGDGNLTVVGQDLLKCGIDSIDGTVNIDMSGDLEVISNQDAISSRDGITIAGSGKVNVTSDFDCLYTCYGDIIFEGCGEISISSLKGSAVEFVHSGYMLCIDGKLSKIFLHTDGSDAAVRSSFDETSPVTGTEIENYDVTGSPESQSVTYTYSATAKTSQSKPRVKNYRVWVNGIVFTEENAASGIPCGDGIATYDVETNTVTLDNATVTTGYEECYVYAKSDLNLVIKGDCLIKNTEGDFGSAVASNGDIFITGDGDLTIDGKELFRYGISAYEGNLTVDMSGDIAVCAADSCFDSALDTTISGSGDILAIADFASFVAFNGNISFTGCGEISGYGVDGPAICIFYSGYEFCIDGDLRKLSLKTDSALPVVFNYQDNTSNVGGSKTDDFDVAGSPDSSSLVFEHKKEYYDVWVNGVRFNNVNAVTGIACGEGKATYDVASDTVTLEDATFTAKKLPSVPQAYDICCVYSDSAINLVIKGNCYMDNATDVYDFGIAANGSINITGDGNLTITGQDTFSAGIITYTGATTIDMSGKLNISANSSGINSDRGIIVSSSGIVTIKSNNIGMYSYKGDIIFTDKGEIYITAGSGEAVRIFCADYKFYLDGDLNKVSMKTDGDNPVVINASERSSEVGGSEIDNYDVNGSSDSSSVEYTSSSDEKSNNPAAKTADYDLWVNGIRMNSDNAVSGIACGSGSATYDASTDTLTLENARITDTYSYETDGTLFGGGIFSESDLNVVIKGDCSITLNKANRGNGIYTKGDLKISGDGNLTAIVESEDYESILCEGAFTYDMSGNLIINGGNIGIYAPSGIEIAGSGYFNVDSHYAGLFTITGGVVISGSGSVRVKALCYAVFIVNKNSSLMLNGTANPIRLTSGSKCSAVYIEVGGESTVSGSSLNNYDVLGAPSSESVTYIYNKAVKNDNTTPTVTPTAVPTVTKAPTATPTAVPTVTKVPTATPTAVPTVTKAPTATKVPTATPTAVPTVTKAPTATPTAVPTVTKVPTATPTVVPTVTKVPTATPTAVPTVTKAPTATPTDKPRTMTSTKSKITPTPVTTVTTTPVPTTNPTEVPTGIPTNVPETVKESENVSSNESLPENKNANGPVFGSLLGSAPAPDPDPIEYKMLDGEDAEWTRGDKEGLMFRSEAPMDKFVSVKVDDAEVDSSDYTVEEGSTIIRFTASFLEKLKDGTHKIEIISNDGSARTRFLIKSAAEPAPVNPPDKTPKTGDKSKVVLWSSLMLISISAVAGINICGKKRRHQ